MSVKRISQSKFSLAMLAASAAALSGAVAGAADLTAPRVDAAVGAIVARTTQSQVYIVQGSSAEAVAARVRTVGGKVVSELPLIRGVGAELTASQAESLRAAGDLRLQADRQIKVSANPVVKNANDKAETFYPTLVRANELHALGIKGTGISIAVLDTGLAASTEHDLSARVQASADFVGSAAGTPVTGDPSGHGTHVASIAASGVLPKHSTKHHGIAPSAGLVVVRAFDAAGLGSYLDVIEGINWVVANRAQHNIRVLNLSFSAPPQSHYWDDPLNQAVMAAWKAGIVVVASAGNSGPQPMTIGVPGQRALRDHRGCDDGQLHADQSGR